MDYETLSLDNANQYKTNNLKQLDGELKPLYERDINDRSFQRAQEPFKKSYENFELTESLVEEMAETWKEICADVKLIMEALKIKVPPAN